MDTRPVRQCAGGTELSRQEGECNAQKGMLGWERRSRRESAPRYRALLPISPQTIRAGLSESPSSSCSSSGTPATVSMLLSAGFSELLGYTSIACWLGAQFP